MPEKTAIEKAVLAAFEHEPQINLHRFPIRVEFDAARGALVLEGEVEHIVAKKRAFDLAGRVPGVGGVMDRLRVMSAERHMAELDAWYVLGVNAVVNRIVRYG